MWEDVETLVDPTVLIHLSKVRLTDLRDVLEEAWRRNAPKRMVAAYHQK